MQLNSSNFVQRQHGFGLVEVLVTLVILAFGLLGVAGLQASALRSTVESGSRGMAVRMANDMAERLRLEPQQLAAYLTAAASDQSAADSSACYGSGGCSGTTRVNAAVGEWQRQLALRLPGGEGIVCRDASPQDGTVRTAADCTGAATDPLVIKVFWRGRALERGAANNGALALRFSMVVMP
jgi:type IV pilus assembly protein PilV